MVKPAYLIPLTPQNLALLGELVVILGQIEEEMVQGVTALIQADRPTTEKVMGASKMANKAGIWSALIKLRHSKNETLLRWVDYACEELSDLSQDRNDFVHANWQHLVQVSRMQDGALVPITKLAMRLSSNREPSANPEGLARRIQNFSKSRSGEELQQVRDKAAALSCVIAHITYCLAPHGEPDGSKSPWLDTLPPLPEPRPAKGEARKGKGRGGQRGPSPA